MKIIDKNKLDLNALKSAIGRPEIFAKSTDRFWDDEHISAQMLKLHLNPDVEAASRKRAIIEAETAFIIERTGMDERKSVLDLGCGPGLYVEEFARTGAKVTGIDLSGRSIAYANAHVKRGHGNITFAKMNYLDMGFAESFDVATLIFYDFCVLNPAEQRQVLRNIHAALKDNGFFVFDVVSENWKTAEATKISVWDSGFWSADPYIEIMNTYMYEDPKTEGMQYTIISENGETRVIRLYHRLFALAEIEKLLNENDFEIEKVYKNLQGDALQGDSETYGIFARKAGK